MNPAQKNPHLLTNLHSAPRRLIDMAIEHADLDAMIDRLADVLPVDEIMLKRLKKRRLALRDKIAQLQSSLLPAEPA